MNARRFRNRATVCLFLVAGLLAPDRPAFGAGGKCAGREGDADCGLYVIARKCVDTTAVDYCTACPSPRPGYCPEKRPCDRTTEVWAANSKYAAIRDLGMCDCNQIMHGLVIPFGAVSGIEDIDRPLTIWKFAWDVASGIMDPNQVALIASSPSTRTQSQLHIHILPLEPKNEQALETTATETVTDLYAVWAKADELAKSKDLASPGILLHKVVAGWHVHLEEAPLADRYTKLPDCVWLNRKKR